MENDVDGTAAVLVCLSVQTMDAGAGEHPVARTSGFLLRSPSLTAQEAQYPNIGKTLGMKACTNGGMLKTQERRRDALFLFSSLTCLPWAMTCSTIWSVAEKLKSAPREG
jgi:hypothetical protein